MAQLIVINNPFDRHNKTITQIDGGLAIFHYLNTQDESIEYVASLNGKITEDFTYILRQHDCLAVVPIPKGGGGGNKVLRTVAMLALSVFAPQMGAYLSKITFASSIATSIFTGAVFLAGGMIINALLPVATPSVNTNTSLEEVSPTYSFSGSSNAREVGTTLPIMLGKARITPPIIGSYLSLEEDKQYLNVLMALNDGEVDSISDIEINNQAIDNFDNVTYDTRLGTNNQTLINGFRDSILTSNVGIGLDTTGGDTVYTTIGNSINELEIVLTLGSGHYYINDSSKYVLPDTPIQYKIEYKLSTDTEYTTYETKTISKVYKTTQRLAINIKDLEQGQYDIRVTRVSSFSEDTRTANSLTLEYVNEIIYDDFIYPNVALLSVKAMATDQLNGNFPTITTIVDNTNTRNVLYPKNNPAWACYDLLKREGIPDSDINLTKFQEWADYCDTEGFTCNLYLDSQQELQSALNMCSVLGRATVVQFGSIFTPIVSKVVDVPTQSFLFTSGNILDGTFQVDYAPYNDRANIIDVTYYDSTDSYNAKTVQVQSDDFDSTSTERKTEINLYGCTDRTIALRYAKFLLNQNRYLSETVSFEADIDSIACTVGDVIKVGVKYMSNTLADGRLSGINGTTITLDQEIDLEENEDYEIQLRLEDDSIYSYNFTADTTESTNTITIDTTLTDEAKNVVFAFGKLDTEATNLYRVTNLSTSNDFIKKITALEYNPTVYDDDVTIEVEESTTSAEVSNLKAQTFLIKNQESYEVGLNVSWVGRKLSYPIYYKLSTDTEYTFLKNVSQNSTTITDLIYGETYDIKVDTQTVQVVFQDNTIPPDVSTFTISGATKEMKTLNFTLANKPIDFKGYEIRYQLGDYPDWNTAIPLSDSLITASPYQTELLSTKGTYTLMIKAVDIFGNESANTSNIIFTQSISLYNNLVFTMDYADNGFNGTISNGTVIDGELVATTDNGDSTWDMSFIGIFYPDVGETAKVIYEGDGSPTIYYRTFGDELFFDSDDAYLPSGDYLYREATQNDWEVYTSGFKAKANTPYQIKIEFDDSPTQPIIREFKVEIDAIDILETLDDVEIPIEGKTVTAENIDSVKWVGGVLQDDGGDAYSVKYIKNTNGALIKVYDINGDATTGLVDILMKGYNNG
ncbi:phage tail protein [Arcobacter arenosus]|uniref:Uncharacterized protein n=1 Tax=Arcobacter arenosus TaxID=2576037 RepID=A0A5R8Y5B8_9BACT|nr:phage tail protein [Arcobacter arenosus]TLP41031.1 hypothetical protein FDK22_03155 [Arcobacter arenosus]